MARQRTNKTTKKRIKVTNPKGNRRAKILYSKSSRNHLKTKRSSQFKRRQKGDYEVSPANRATIVRKIVNL